MNRYARNACRANKETGQAGTGKEKKKIVSKSSHHPKYNKLKFTL